MNDGQDSQLETLLREHLASKLDSQLGRSAERFMSECGGAAPASRMRLVDTPQRPPLPRLRLFGWSVGIAGAAVAAGIAIVMGLPSLVSQPRPTIDRPKVAINDANPTPIVPASADHEVARDVEHGVSWRTVDRGTVYLDDEIPLRSLFREQVETVSWYDPKREAHVQMEIPRDQVMLVGYNSY